MRKKIITNSRSSAQGQVRIIGGDWRGRKLPVLNGEGLRPTSDRVRETLFNWLQFEVPGANCLDVFAGSGALGLEALSRGAEKVTFIELSSPVAAQLKQNLSTLKASQGEVVARDSVNYLAKTADQAYDIVFVDPPFHQGLMQQTVDALLQNGWLKNSQAWLYLEQEKNLAWPQFPEGWVCRKEKSTSQVKYGLFTQED